MTRAGMGRVLSMLLTLVLGTVFVAAIARNAALIWMAGWLLTAAPRKLVPGRARAAGRPSGFTLVEMLVVIVIASILVALTVGVLRGVRETARVTRRVSTIRQLQASLSMYSGDQGEQFPFFGTANDPLGPVRVGGIEIAGPYFRTQRWFWASAIYPEYYPAPRASIEDPGRVEFMQQVLGWPESIVATDYVVTSTLFAHPRFWSDDSTGGQAWMQDAYFAPTRMSDVAFPSSKGSLIWSVTGSAGVSEDEIPVALMDGSARPVPANAFDLTTGVERPFGATGFPVDSTRGGLAGVDFR